MKKQISLFVFTLLFSASLFAEGLKIGVVNMQKLQNQAPQIQKMVADLQKRFGPQKEQLEKLAQTIQSDEKALKQNELLMTKDKLTAARKDLVAKVQSFREQEAQLGKEIQVARNQELAVFSDTVNNILSALAKKDKYDLILNDGVVYMDSKLDVTDKILAELKKQ